MVSQNQSFAAVTTPNGSFNPNFGQTLAAASQGGSWQQDTALAQLLKQSNSAASAAMSAGVLTPPLSEKDSAAGAGGKGGNTPQMRDEMQAMKSQMQAMSYEMEMLRGMPGASAGNGVMSTPSGSLSGLMALNGLYPSQSNGSMS